MDLLYISCVNLDDEKSGITRKVFSQYRCLNASFHASLVGYWGKEVALVSGEEKEVISSGKSHRRIAVIKEAISASEKMDHPNVYIRRMPCNPFVMHLLKELKNKGCKKIIWEIPTYPYDREFKGFRYTLKRCMDQYYRKQLKNFVERIVTFAPEEEIFGIKTIKTGNGIEVDSLRQRKIREADGTLRLLGVAVLNNWHGYDRLIRGLAKYQGEKKVIFHLVGDGPCLGEYQELAKSLGVEKHVIFYGAKNKEEIEDIYDQCDMAVESLGWHRSGVTMGTSIKTREYVAKGMPILASSPMDIFPEGWEYAYYAPIDDTPIEVQKVVDFYGSLLERKSIDELARVIREVAYERCDMRNMMQPIVDYFVKE